MLNGSLTIARIGGTEIRLHWTMILIIPYVLVTFRPDSLTETVRAFLLVTMIFAFVLLHELGHTLVARAFGIRVPSVVLWPLGGAAMTEREAGKPIADLLIAAAGPVVNLILGGIFGVLFLFNTTAGWLGISLPLPELISRSTLVFLAITNVILAITNLLPMYPLDGGRIFRAVVNMIFGPARSNQVTFWLSLLLGVGLLAASFAIGNLWLGLTALLLLAGAITLNQPLLGQFMAWYARMSNNPQAFLRIADFDPALEIINKRIDVDSRNPVLYLQRAYIYYTLDEPLRALADADRALVLIPDLMQAVLLRGAIYYAMGNLAEAWKCVERAEMLRPGWSNNWLNSAILRRDEGDLQAAAENVQRAFDAIAKERDQSGMVLLHLVRSSILYQQGQQAAARLDWEAAYRFASRDAMTFAVDRQCIFARDWNWVRGYFAFLESQSPDSPLIFAARGETALRAGQWQQAVEDFTRLISQMPALQDVSIYRGQAYQQLGKLDLAAADFRRAIQVTRRAHIRRMAEAQLKALVVS